MFISSILSNPIYRLAFQIGGILAVIVFLFTAIKIHDSNIKSIALQEFNKMQLEETIKNQKEYIDKLKRIEEVQANISQNINDQKNKLDSSLSGIEEFLSSAQTKAASKPVSNIIQHTIKRLREQQ